MRRLVVLVACLGLAVAVMAQEGHPLSGTWSGDWGPTATDRTHVTLVMNWDGKDVTGTWNPGPDSVPLKSVYLDPTTWTVRIEADPKDATGKPVHLAIEGRLEDLSSYHRRIVGTWTRDTGKGDFRLTRD
jgi:hypothetical protein